MRVLALTNLFPNARQPNLGIFNLQEFAALGRLCEIRVVAPLPWQPWKHGFTRPVPYEEEWQGIPTLHPLYFYTPGIARGSYARTMHASLRSTFHRLATEFQPDAILAPWAYPDGVVASMLARNLGIPWVGKVLGSDLNVMATTPNVSRQIGRAMSQAARVFAVSGALRQRLIEMGVPPDKVCVQHNGVNVDWFCPGDRTEARAELGLSQERPLLLCVGNLEAIKGMTDLLAAVRQMPTGEAGDPLVVIVGEGRLRPTLEETIRQESLSSRVRLIGARPHREVPRWLAAADALCLPSRHEGCPNVVLEALACGRPVVATRVGAVPDLIDAECGAVVPPREPAQLATAMREVLRRTWDPAAIRARVLPLSWEANAATLAEELGRAVAAIRTTRAS